MSSYTMEEFINWLKNNNNISNVIYLSKLSEALQYLIAFVRNFKCSDENILEITSSKDFEIIINKIKSKKVFVLKDKLNHYIYSKVLDFYLKYLYFQEDTIEECLYEDSPETTKNNEAEFLSWMIEKEGWSQNTARNYISGISTINDLCFGNKIIDRTLFSYSTAEDINHVYSRIISNEQFIDKNRNHHNLYSAALNKYILFLEKENGNYLATNELAPSALAIKQRKSKTGKENEYANWMLEVENLSQNTVRNYLSAMYNINNLCMRKSIIDISLFEISTYDELSMFLPRIINDPEFKEKNKQMHNQYIAALNKFIKFSGAEVVVDIVKDNLESTRPEITELKSVLDYTSNSVVLDDLDKAIVSVLEKLFVNGININSIISIRRLINELRSLLPNGNFQDEQTLKVKVIRHAINIHDNIYMAPSSILPDLLLEEILGFTLEMLRSGRKIVYFENIYVKFKEKLIYTNIHDNEVLGNVIKHYLGNDVIYSRGAISIDPGAKGSIDDEILEVLLSSDMPLGKEYICEMLPHILPEKIETFLKVDSRSIYVSQGVYWHVDRYDVSQADKFLLEDIIRYEIQNGFVSSKKLLEIFKIQASNFVEKNGIVNYVCLKDILKYYFSDMFDFRFTFIGKHGEEMSGVVATRNFVSDKDYFTLTELIEFISENELPTLYGLFFNEIAKDFIRTDKENFIRKKNFVCSQITIEEIEETLEKFLENGYIAIGKIDSFSIFPTIAYRWNGYILKCIVESFCERYSVLDFSNSVSKPTGIIVSKSSPFKDYDAVLEDVLAQRDKFYPFNSMDDAMDFLFVNGYLAQRRYKNSELIFAAAKQRNLQIEGLE